MNFPKLKQLTLNGKILKKLAKVLPPKCAGCLFGAMTKLPWQGKETKAKHEVFVATKPGECILVDQMTSTEVRFYAQLKSKLTKKYYKSATIFGNHSSCLWYWLPPTWWQVQQDTHCQACLQTVPGRTRSQDSSLPLQQWMLPQQHLPASMLWFKTMTHLLWGKCPLPKWHHQASHPRSLGKRVKATAPSTHPLARGNPLCIVAICIEKCSLPSQQPTHARGHQK